MRARDFFDAGGAAFFCFLSMEWGNENFTRESGSVDFHGSMAFLMPIRGVIGVWKGYFYALEKNVRGLRY